jgi:hypothetical protein
LDHHCEFLKDFRPTAGSGILLLMEFEFRLTGAGWAEARIADDARTAIVTASYLSDALGDLLAAVGVLLEGASESRCSWAEEPGEYRWLFVRTSDDDVELTILEFDDMFDWPDADTISGVRELSPQPDERGEIHFQTWQPLSVLARAIADGASAALAEHGAEGYLEQWIEAPFPTAHLAMIREHLQRSGS